VLHFVTRPKALLSDVEPFWQFCHLTFCLIKTFICRTTYKYIAPVKHVYIINVLRVI